MIQFRLKRFSEEETEEPKKKSNLRAGLEGLGITSGIIGSGALGYHYGNKKYESDIEKKGGEAYINLKKSHTNSIAAREKAEKEANYLSKKVGKSKILEGVGEENAKAITDLINKNKTNVENLKSAEKKLKGDYSKLREEVLNRDRNFEKAVLKGVGKGLGITALGVGATYGAKKLYDKYVNKEK